MMKMQQQQQLPLDRSRRNQALSFCRPPRDRTLTALLLGASVVVFLCLCPSVRSLTSGTFPTISNMGQQQQQQQPPRSSSKQQQQQQPQQQQQQQQPPPKTGSPTKTFPVRIAAMGTAATQMATKTKKMASLARPNIPFSVPAVPGGEGGTERTIPRPPSSSSSSSSSLSSFAVHGATTAPAPALVPAPALATKSATKSAATTTNNSAVTENLYSSFPPKAAAVAASSSQDKHDFAPVKASWKPATTAAAAAVTATAATVTATAAKAATTTAAEPTRTDHNDSKTTNQQQQQPPKTKKKKFTMLPEFGALSSELFGSLKSVGRGEESTTTHHHETQKSKTNTFALPELFSTFSPSAQGTTPRPSPFSSPSSSLSSSSTVTAAAATTPTTMYSTAPPPKGGIPKKSSWNKSSQPKNYAPVQATWKTTPTTTGAAETLASATSKAQQQFDVFSNSFLPEFPEGFFSSSTSFTPSFTPNLSIQFPDLPALPTTIRVQEYSDEVQRRSAAIDHDIKQKVNAFTQQKEYKVGDITKAIIAKIAHDDFDPAEVTFFFRILIAVGADLSGFSAVLPVGGLIGLFGWSISMGIAERVTKTIAVETNKRINNTKSSEDDNNNETAATASSSTTGPASSLSAATYVPGDLTKRAVLEYTGKSSYAQGDLAQQALSVRTATDDDDDDVGTVVDMTVLQELEACLSMEKELIQKLDRIQRGQ